MNIYLNTEMANDVTAKRPPMTALRTTSLVAGTLYLLTFISIPTLVLYGPVHRADWVTGQGPDNAVIIGGILEIIVALAGIGTAVVLYPLLGRRYPALALGLVVSRVLEASTIFLGVAFLLSVVSLRQSGGGVSSLASAHALVILYDRIFLLGQSFMPALNDLILGFLLYRCRLVPRALSIIGIAGALPLIAGWLAVLFGSTGQHSPVAGLSALLVALFEFSLGIWLIVKGFRPAHTTNREAHV